MLDRLAFARVRSALALVVALVLVLLVGSVPASAAGEELLTIADPRITESSGLAASLRHPGVYWTHNDSGDGNRLYAIGPDGGTRATVTLAGADAVDWEAMALGRDEAGRPALYVGDIGDNDRRRGEVALYRIPEPETLADVTVTAVRYRVRYADGPRDAEAMLIDPRTNTVYIADKTSDGNLYAHSGPLDPAAVTVFGRVADAPNLVTDGAFAPDGSRFILRGYFSADMYSTPGKRVGTVPMPLQRQGESVTFAADGASVLFGSEGKNSTVVRVGLSGQLRPETTGSAPVAPAQPAPIPASPSPSPPAVAPPAPAPPPSRAPEPQPGQAVVDLPRAAPADKDSGLAGLVTDPLIATTAVVALVGTGALVWGLRRR